MKLRNMKPSNKSKKNRIKNCLRYPGGKFYGFKFLEPFLETPHNEFREPFVGGGSVFLGKSLVKKNWVNDNDKELITFYKVISDDSLEK